MEVADYGTAFRRSGWPAGLALAVTDTNAIIDAGSMRTPALAIDGEVVIEGKVANTDEIRRLLA